ncbi:hypothetical protein [Oscillatoria sp. FACHB-1406]|uniref:hypothetical protein n=1 Tax=Oscillatoria sp. FACHB-1406 TaxID=2692846 RepID=UPI00168832F3|nr:hypothetical protein [Oscillatoria sp. FACHB-1406]MBD2578022.1 hypothetical protein [Oscillatoria sp. FACHB-1406]
MSQEFRFILPAPPPPAEWFATHHLAREFRHEIEARQQFQDYCEWYAETAERHQKELRSMRGDIKLFGWFLRGFRG